MKSFNQFINESQDLDKKPVGREFIKGLLRNITDATAKKFLEDMLKRDKDQDKILFTQKQYNLLGLIKTYGKIDQKQFSSKN